MRKPITDSEGRCSYFDEETSLLHRLHAAYIITFRGDVNQER